MAETSNIVDRQTWTQPTTPTGRYYKLIFWNQVQSAALNVPTSGMDIESSSFSYHEPSVVTVLILTGFLLLLNISNYILDRLVYCGLLGQILVGVWFGTPGAKWLSAEVEGATQLLGYLGLILLVYEGMIIFHIRKILLLC